MDKPKEILCARCGHVNSGDCEHCRSCGERLTASTPNDRGATDSDGTGTQTILVFNRRKGPKRYRLVMVDENGKELQSFDLKDGSIIGRTEGDIQLHDRHVSRRHCTFLIQNDHLLLKDLNSTNGVFVRIRDALHFKAPAELMIGHTICRVVRKN